jgi:hypothetical protein
MTDTPEAAPPNPPDVDPLDVRISAALDGRADPEAPHPSSGPPSFDDDASAARARDLEHARSLLAVPPPPLDDLTRRRLVRVALDERSQSRRHTNTAWARLTAVAAVLVVVLAAGWGVVRFASHSGPSKSSSAAGSATETTASGAIPNLHEVSNPAVLLRRVRAALALPPAQPDHENGFSATTTAAPPAAPSAASTTARASAGLAAGSGSQCVGSLRLPAGVNARPFASATFHGAPAVVLVANEHPRILIYVLALDNCRLLTSQFFRE